MITDGIEPRETQQYELRHKAAEHHDEGTGSATIMQFGHDYSQSCSFNLLQGQVNMSDYIVGKVKVRRGKQHNDQQG
jgi:hypothetical protein